MGDLINIGAAPNDHAGDDFRTVCIKVNGLAQGAITNPTAAFRALNVTDPASQRLAMGAASAQDTLTALAGKSDKTDIPYLSAATAGVVVNDATAATANGGKIAQLEAAASALGGAVIVFPSGTIWSDRPLAMATGVYYEGQGRGVTTHKLAGGANCASLKSVGYDTLKGTDTANGVTHCGFRRITFDGNKANQTVAGSGGVYIYGYAFAIDDFEIVQTKGPGLVTEWGTGNSPLMESWFGRGLVRNTDRTGISLNGPHDSMVSQIVIEGASEEADNTYDGWYFGPKMSGQVGQIHYYGPGGAPSAGTPDARYALNDESAGMRFSNSAWEAGVTATLRLASGGISVVDKTCYVIGALGGPLVAIEQAVEFYARLQEPSSTVFPSVGFRIGKAGATVVGVVIDSIVYGCVGGVLDLTYSGGSHRIKILGSAASGAAVIGSFQVTDDIELNVSGMSNGIYRQQPATTLGSSTAQFPPSGLVIPRSGHATSKNASLGLGGWSFNSDPSGTGYESLTFYSTAFGGNVLQVNPDASAYFSGGIALKPPASAVPSTNGQLMFEATSNTSLTLRFKGSDGTVRSATLALS